MSLPWGGGGSSRRRFAARPHPWSGRSAGEEGWFGVFERCRYTRALARGDRYAEMETRQQQLQLEEARQRREQAEEKDAGADAAE